MPAFKKCPSAAGVRARSPQPAFLRLRGRATRAGSVSSAEVPGPPRRAPAQAAVPFGLQREARARPRPGEGEGSPRRKPASRPAQNTPPPKTFFSQLRATFFFCLFAQHIPLPSLCSLRFPRLPRPSPQRGGPGLPGARGEGLAGRRRGHRAGKGEGKRVATAREEELVKGDRDGRVPEKESDAAVCCSRNKVRALSSAFAASPPRLCSLSFDSWALAATSRSTPAPPGGRQSCFPSPERAGGGGK